jgi:hypothetical protein
MFADEFGALTRQRNTEHPQRQQSDGAGFVATGVFSPELPFWNVVSAFWPDDRRAPGLKTGCRGGR